MLKLWSHAGVAADVEAAVQTIRAIWYIIFAVKGAIYIRTDSN